MKYLGVVIDSLFKFDMQVNILRKMAIGINALKFIAGQIPLNARIQILNALVVSHLSYANVLLNRISQFNKNKLEKTTKLGP